MRTLIFLVLLAGLDHISEKAYCQPEHDQVLSITATTAEQLDILKNITSHNETWLWQPASPEYISVGSEVHMHIPQAMVRSVRALLDNNGLRHRLLLENTEKLIEEQTRNVSSDPRAGGIYYERYHSLEDIYHFLNKTSMDYPEMTKLVLIGSSYEKRPLYALKLSGTGGGDSKKIMWMDCGIHAREWISPAFCLWFVQYALAFYKINGEITVMLDNMDIYVLPVLNPDGYKYTWTTNRMWRKNRSISKGSGCVGVDLNRNFDANWCTTGASSDPCRETYCGQYPESEPESQAVANFLRSHKDSVALYLSIHSYSQMLLFPYSCSYELAENHDELLELAKTAAQQIKRYYRNSYTYGAGATTIYLAPGGSDDWAYKQGIKYSFTFELQDRGRYGFLLPPSLIPQACNEALLATKVIAAHVVQKLHGGLRHVPTA